MGRRPGLALLTALVAALLFGAWTWLTFGVGAFAGLDAASLTPGVSAASAWGQVLSAVALLTTPTMVYVALALVSWWAARRRLSNLAWAAGLSIPITWGLIQATKVLFQRPRPDTALPLLTAEGYAYPSGHLTAATVLGVIVLAAMVLTRRRRGVRTAAAVVIVLAWWFILYNRWELRAHWFSDLFAGGFLGGAIAATALALAGVHVVRLPDPGRALVAGEPRPRAAVIVNPTKVPDTVVFRRQVDGECAERGWAPPLWFETEADDAGASAARRARRRKVELVLVAGGDGTVRAVCSTLAGTGLPIAILPIGTGNLLARNLGVPMDLAEALDSAFEATPRTIDIIELRADGSDPEYSLVLAGMGADASMISETNPDLKKVVGPAAYVMAAVQAANRPPFPATVTIDHGETLARTPAMCLVANVGYLQGSFALVPDAVPDDGLLDVLIASPRNAAGWAAITSRVLTRSPDAPGVERAQAKRVVFETDADVPYQIDGDAVGRCRRLEASVLPASVTVMAP